MSSLTLCETVVDMVVLGVDPGLVNFAFTALNGRTQEVLYANSINICPRLATYRSIAISVCIVMQRLYERFHFQIVCVEMQLREHMIAVMQSVCCWSVMQNIECEIVPATLWRRRVGLRNTRTYAQNKAQSVRCRREFFGLVANDHNVAESTLIAIGCALSKGLVEPPYFFFLFFYLWTV